MKEVAFKRYKRQTFGCCESPKGIKQEDYKVPSCSKLDSPRRKHVTKRVRSLFLHGSLITVTKYQNFNLSYKILYVMECYIMDVCDIKCLNYNVM